MRTHVVEASDGAGFMYPAAFPGLLDGSVEGSLDFTAHRGRAAPAPKSATGGAGKVLACGRHEQVGGNDGTRGGLPPEVICALSLTYTYACCVRSTPVLTL